MGIEGAGAGDASQSGGSGVSTANVVKGGSVAVVSKGVVVVIGKSREGAGLLGAGAGKGMSDKLDPVGSTVGSAVDSKVAVVSKADVVVISTGAASPLVSA